MTSPNTINLSATDGKKNRYANVEKVNFSQQQGLAINNQN